MCRRCRRGRTSSASPPTPGCARAPSPSSTNASPTVIRRLRFLPTPVLLLVLLLGAGCELFNEVDPGEGGLPGPDPLTPPLLLYVANQDDASVTVIDMNENEVLRTVNLTAYGFAADAAPYAIAVEPDASAWYVALSG